MVRQAGPQVLEILTHNSSLSMSIFAQDSLATIKHYSQCRVSFPEIQRVCQEIMASFYKFEKNGVGDKELLAIIQRRGQFLWEHLLTPQIKDALKQQKTAGLILSLDEELMNIPWELIHDGSDFLALNFDIGRLVRTKREPRIPVCRSLQGSVKMLIVADPTHDLNAAYREGQKIRSAFDPQRERMRIDFKTSHVDTLYLKKNLPEYDILHFCGHGEFNADTPSASGWVFEDGIFTSADILRLGTSSALPSLIFANACHSAEIPRECSLRAFQEKNYSMASAFLFSGVRHYIGSIHKVEDEASLQFAQEFYTQLLAGHGVGLSIRLARLKLVQRRGLSSLYWAYYILYGDPSFKLVKSIPTRAFAKVSFIVSFSKRFSRTLLLVISVLSVAAMVYMAFPMLNPTSFILFKKSGYLFRQGRNAEASVILKHIIRKDPLFLDAYPMLADIYQRQGDSAMALKYYFDYSMASEKNNKTAHRASAYNQLGWFYYLQGDGRKAFDLYQKAYAVSKEHADWINQATALRKMAVWHIDQEEYDKALELLTKSSEINRERQSSYAHRFNLACDYFDMGLVFANKDDFVTAKEFYRKSLLIFEKLKVKIMCFCCVIIFISFVNLS
ncbi:MAG: CHAT domain-containing protein [Candidatus Omnitrophica bacterium]|nr:CHAT domain-containing protein [Candidatus Omnitrophota bacterium]